MGQVVWSPSSLDDVERIAEYIARDSAANAALFVSRLIQATDRLQAFPKSGHMIPELNDPAYREIVYGPYRIMFKLDNADVWITGVVHGARDWKPDVPHDK